MADGLLTDLEHQTLTDLGAVWGQLCKIGGTGPTRPEDLTEAMIHIHALQNLVMAQAAARAYPDRYRLAGESLRSHTQPSGDDNG